jgi:hypothetical protein
LLFENDAELWLSRGSIDDIYRKLFKGQTIEDAVLRPTNDPVGFLPLAKIVPTC